MQLLNTPFSWCSPCKSIIGIGVFISFEDLRNEVYSGVIFRIESRNIGGVCLQPFPNDPPLRFHTLFLQPSAQIKSHVL